ncbi:PH domain-containing protein [Nocardiopsis changdeensis]|uniref:PH domain-containing protein n=1 Tax=Nocardiopsis changdeensis TaxID=2831969 RepID=A0ABX8BPN0_9ACTN|nr:MULTISPECIES: PH domain-containing protein [Nocardiopsis]QUX23680.1 PH domain-containing protein [Nocardiopsis changdeensis]QYX39624.1 PH domain-containing protein [Nocardiopsis sp. MT53]
MAIADRHLSDDEELVHVVRQHWTVLVEEFTALAAIVAATAAALWFLPWQEEWAPAAAGVVGVLALVAALVFWLVPLLRWSSTVYILTDRRLMTRQGLISRKGRDMPLTRVNDVAFSMSVWERVMRYGTLTVQSASEQEAITLRKVPRPEWFQSEIYRRVDGAHRPESPAAPR